MDQRKSSWRCRKHDYNDGRGTNDPCDISYPNPYLWDYCLLGSAYVLDNRGKDGKGEVDQDPVLRTVRPAFDRESERENFATNDREVGRIHQRMTRKSSAAHRRSGRAAAAHRTASPYSSAPRSPWVIPPPPLIDAGALQLGGKKL